MKKTHTGKLTLSNLTKKLIRENPDPYAESIINMDGETLDIGFVEDNDPIKVVHFMTPCGHEAALALTYFTEVKTIQKI